MKFLIFGEKFLNSLFLCWIKELLEYEKFLYITVMCHAPLAAKLDSMEF